MSDFIRRQPDDPGVDPLDDPIHWYDRQFSYRLLAVLLGIEAAAIVAFLVFIEAL